MQHRHSDIIAASTNQIKRDSGVEVNFAGSASIAPHVLSDWLRTLPPLYSRFAVTGEVGQYTSDKQGPLKRSIGIVHLRAINRQQGVSDARRGWSINCLLKSKRPLYKIMARRQERMNIWLPAIKAIYVSAIPSSGTGEKSTALIKATRTRTCIP